MSSRALWGVAAALALVAGPAVHDLAAQAPAPRHSLTVYPGGGALVRETRAVALVRGTNRLALGQLPTSVRPESFIVLTPGVTLAGHRGVTVTQPAGGGAQLATLDLDLFAEAPVSELRVAYLTEGFTWTASYSVVVSADDRAADLTGLATVSNRSGVALAGAELQLLAGEIYRARGIHPGPMMARALEAVDAAPVGLPAGEVGDVHLYTLPDRIDLQPGGDRAVRLLGATGLPAEKRYVLRQGVSFVSRGGDGSPTSVEVAYKVRRPTAEGLGDAPIPAGLARVFRPDDAGRLQLVGETALANTPKGEDLWLPIGRAFEITGHRTQTDYQVRARGRYESAWRVVLRNRTKRAASVEVVETARGQWRILSATHPHERKSATVFTFQVDVPAEGEATLEYRIEVEG